MARRSNAVGPLSLGAGRRASCAQHAAAMIMRLSASDVSIFAMAAAEQTSVIAGTVFENSLVPLTKWFQATWLITQSKNSISTLELSRQIGVKWDTAWRLRQKLASVMAEVEARRSFKGRIEMDDAVLGGEKSEAEGGKRGRGGANKVPFVVAVETTAEGRPRRVLLHLVERHDGNAIERWPMRN